MDTAFVAARAAQSTRSSPELTAAFRAEQPGRGRAGGGRATRDARVIRHRTRSDLEGEELGTPEL